MSNSFLVQFCSNWDGGKQERDAAIRFIKEAKPSAEVASREVDEYPVTVKIFQVTGGAEVEVFKCRQQDLFKKNGWPAKASILKIISKL